MRRLVLLLVVVVLVVGGIYLGLSGSSVQFSEPAKLVGVGDAAPDFQLEDTEGNLVSLSGLRGKVVLVNLWATWCPPCREEMPSMERLHNAMAGEDFVMLAVNAEVDGKKLVPEFLKQTPYTFPILYDDKGVVQSLYGVSKFPESFIIRKDGTIAEKIIGPLDWSSPKTIAYFKNLGQE